MKSGHPGAAMPRRPKSEATALAKEGGVSAPKDELRRIRNRLSQRAIRERRAVRLQQLEQQVAQSRETESDSRLDDLQTECQKLREGLLSVRKKLLSLSTTSSSVADGIRAILDLDPDAGRDAPEEDEKVEVEDVVVVEEEEEELRSLFVQPTPNQAQLSPSTEEIFPEAEISGTFSPLPLHESQQDLNDQIPLMTEPFNFLHTAVDLNGFGPRNDIFKTSYSDARRKRPEDDMWKNSEIWTNDPVPEQSYSRLGDTLTLELDPANSSLTSQAIWSLSSPKQGSVFSDHLDYIQKLVRLSGLGEAFARPPPVMHTLLHAFVALAWPTMTTWFTTTNSCASASALLWWQATRSPQSFLDVASHNSPTPSQLIHNYPSIIAWIPSEKIRNLMIVNYPLFDIDELIIDMTDSYVVDEDDDCEPMSVMEMVHRYSSHSPPSSPDSFDHPPSNFIQANRLSKFKIDPSFFVKYPSLYDASAIARRRCRAIDVHQRSGSPNPPVAFGLEAAERYLDLILQARMNGFR